MKQLLPFIFSWCCVAAALGQPLTNMVPNGLANVEGNSSTSDPFTSPSFRLQQVFDASQFAFLGSGTCRIDAISFRIDGAATGNAAFSFGGSTIQLSTTTAGADSLSPIFANNIGPNVTTIFNGGVGIGNLYDSSANPQPFNRFATATTPFFYSPSQGNLLLDIIAGGGQTLFPGGIDAQSLTGDSVSRVWATSETATLGNTDSLGLVTRFDITAVPEPGILLLTALGITMALIGKWRGKWA